MSKTNVLDIEEARGVGIRIKESRKEVEQSTWLCRITKKFKDMHGYSYIFYTAMHLEIESSYRFAWLAMKFCITMRFPPDGLPSQ